MSPEQIRSIRAVLDAIEEGVSAEPLVRLRSD